MTTRNNLKLRLNTLNEFEGTEGNLLLLIGLLVEITSGATLRRYFKVSKCSRTVNPDLSLCYGGLLMVTASLPVAKTNYWNIALYLLKSVIMENYYCNCLLLVLVNRYYKI